MSVRPTYANGFGCSTRFWKSLKLKYKIIPFPFLQENNMYMSIITLVRLEPGPIISPLVDLFFIFPHWILTRFPCTLLSDAPSLCVILTISHFLKQSYHIGRIPSQFHIIKFYSYYLCLHKIFPKNKAVSISLSASVFLFASRSSSTATCFSPIPFSDSFVAPYKVRSWNYTSRLQNNSSNVPEIEAVWNWTSQV